MFLLVVALLCLVAHTLAGTCHFDVELTWGTGSPDGYEREMVFINGQFPGPTMEITQDDWVEIVVYNNMPFNTSLHAHGIEQIDSPEADGVPGFTQRPIQPGDTFTYKWRASQYGAYFYHAHARGQIDDGCYGPLLIRPKSSLERPFDKIDSGAVDELVTAESQSTPLIISDWRHTDSSHTWDLQLASGLESSVCMDSILVNGKGAVDCWSREDLDKFTNPGIAPLLRDNNKAMTDKGCLPPEILQILLGKGSESNPSALPDSVFNVCTPTKGSREVIQAPKDTEWLALDLISSASIATFSFSIDEHPLWIYAVDGHYIEPMKVDALSLANGDRYSVFVHLDKEAKDYGIRVASTALVQLLDTTAVLSYGGDGSSNLTSIATINRAGGVVSRNSTAVFDQTQMVSFPPQFPQPAPEPNQTFILNLQTVSNSYSWALNGSSFNHGLDDLDPPLLYQDPNAFPKDTTTIVTKNNTWVDLVFVVPTLSQPPHPIHKHSNKAFIIGSGQGAFTWKSVAEAAAAVPGSFDFVSPAYRDGFLTPATAVQPVWVAIRYQVVNPGPFMLHCHIQSHLNGGMAMTILDGVDEWPQAST